MSRSEHKPIPVTSDVGDSSSRDLHRLRAELTRTELLLHEEMARAAAEKDAVARELHDKVGQILTAIDLEVANILSFEKTSPEMTTRLEGLRKLAAQGQSDVSDLCWQIRPESLGGLDLEQAAHQLAKEWGARKGIVFDLHLSIGARKIPPATETTLYRVLQEAIRNVVKHADATRVGIILRSSPKEIVLIVEDDGDGFIWTDNDRPALALGLKGVKERVELLGGSLDVETAPNAGTTLLVSVPL